MHSTLVSVVGVACTIPDCNKKQRSAILVTLSLMILYTVTINSHTLYPHTYSLFVSGFCFIPIASAVTSGEHTQDPR